MILGVLTSKLPPGCTLHASALSHFQLGPGKKGKSIYYQVLYWTSFNLERVGVHPQRCLNALCFVEAKVWMGNHQAIRVNHVRRLVRKKKVE